MKKMNRKGFTLVELLAVIVILAILMAIAATNLGPVIDNTRRNSMRSTAQQIINSVQSQLTSNYELYPGTYEWDEGIFDKGGKVAPFGGEYRYHTGGGTKIGSGVYKKDGSTAAGSCSKTSTSYIVIKRDASGNYKYLICLSTHPDGNRDGEGNAYLFATRDELEGKSNKIFHGDAVTSEGVAAPNWGADEAPSETPTNGG